MKSFISHGLISRVGIFFDGFDDVEALVATIAYERRKKTKQDAVSRYVPIFLYELNAFLEALILSDKLAIDYVHRNVFYLGKDGFSNASLEQIIKHENESFLIQPVELNISSIIAGNGYSNLYNKLTSAIDIAIIRKTYPDEITLVWAFHYALANSVSPREIYNGKGLNAKKLYDALFSYFSSEAIHFCNCEDAKLIIEILDKTLGQTWLDFRAIAEEKYNDVPNYFFAGPFHYLNRNECEIGLNKLFFIFSLYEDVIDSLKQADLLTINYSASEYYGKFDSGRSRKYTILGFSDLARKKLKNLAGSMQIKYSDLLVPQILQMCLSDATSLMDVVDNALKLREENWVKSFSNYLKELSFEENDYKLVKKIQLIDSFIEKKLKGKVALGDGGISLSPFGDISFSQSGLFDFFRERSNRALRFHSKSISYIKGSNHIKTISYIIKAKESDVTRYLR